MKLRRALLLLLGLWVALGIVLAPARPMPEMEMGAAPALAQNAAIALRLEHEANGHHDAVKAPSPLRSDPEPSKQDPLGHDHLARCALCVVGAGMLALIIAVVWASSPARAPTANPRPFTQPTRFRHFRSRAPPLAV